MRIIFLLVLAMGLQACSQGKKTLGTPPPVNDQPKKQEDKNETPQESRAPINHSEVFKNIDDTVVLMLNETLYAADAARIDCKNRELACPQDIQLKLQISENGRITEEYLLARGKSYGRAISMTGGNYHRIDLHTSFRMGKLREKLDKWKDDNVNFENISFAIVTPQTRRTVSLRELLVEISRSIVPVAESQTPPPISKVNLKTLEESRYNTGKKVVYLRTGEWRVIVRPFIPTPPTPPADR